MAAAPQREREGRQAGLATAMRRVSALGASTSAAPARGAKRFPNGDTYTGGWRNGVPEGEGRYCWADGSVYEGGWRVSHARRPSLSDALMGCIPRVAWPGCDRGGNADMRGTIKKTGG